MMLADTAERYLTSPLFNLIDSEMNEDEEVILNLFNFFAGMPATVEFSATLSSTKSTCSNNRISPYIDIA